MESERFSSCKETIHADGGRDATRAGHACRRYRGHRESMRGRFVEDLAPMFDIGAQLAERLMPEMMALLPRPAIAYGKAAIVGVNGELEHAAALLHPKMGKPIRAAIGGGEAIIPSTSKVAGNSRARASGARPRAVRRTRSPW